MTPLPHRLLAEFLGCLLLFASVIGSGILAQQLAAGNDGVALLGNTLATVAMLGLLITILGPISGAQFNPAVTLVMALHERTPAASALAIIAAQLLAAPAAVALAHAMFNQPLFQIATHARNTPGELLGEAVATFTLLLTILGTLAHRPAAIALTVPAAITAGYWWTSSTSFANPAITLARAMTDSFSGIRPGDTPGFIAAQFAGALLALAVGRLLFTSSRSDIPPGPSSPAPRD
ncbi:aquaporin [Sandaracinobacteroides saxicola]|uniref:Aquaporin n=1 Tax=Sandaracinobacteroides saxicola TaxID=2759707 RepID=A0A7G5ILC5_9SPHN|nr:aquaporin [Sandaracinobacteroides saxicola]QMW24167.1 aquaporin [Sandaracinobacteroides saxicola]